MKRFKFKRMLTILPCVLYGYLMINSSVIYAKEHHHNQSEKAKLAANGIFTDDAVKDRALSDWQGSWQSVYPYLLNGDLQPVLKAKSKKSKTKTVQDYHDYYMQGYKTDINEITINDHYITFSTIDNSAQCQYKYKGYKILTYASSNRGVRYLFECQDDNTSAPKYIQFSDHIIEPMPASHFHIYMGNESQDALLKEMDNWPTYYPAEMDGEEIVHDMLYH